MTPKAEDHFAEEVAKIAPGRFKFVDRLLSEVVDRHGAEILTAIVSHGLTGVAAYLQAIYQDAESQAYIAQHLEQTRRAFADLVLIIAKHEPELVAATNRLLVKRMRKGGN